MLGGIAIIKTGYFIFFSSGVDFRRQIMTSKDGPRTERARHVACTACIRQVIGA